jgi:hypothetical protein
VWRGRREDCSSLRRAQAYNEEPHRARHDGVTEGMNNKLLAIIGAVSLFGGFWGGAYFDLMNMWFDSRNWWGFPLYMTIVPVWFLASIVLIVTGISRIITK